MQPLDDIGEEIPQGPTHAGDLCAMADELDHAEFVAGLTGDALGQMATRYAQALTLHHYSKPIPDISLAEAEADERRTAADTLRGSGTCNRDPSAALQRAASAARKRRHAITPRIESRDGD